MLEHALRCFESAHSKFDLRFLIKKRTEKVPVLLPFSVLHKRVRIYSAKSSYLPLFSFGMQGFFVDLFSFWMYHSFTLLWSHTLSENDESRRKEGTPKSHLFQQRAKKKKGTSYPVPFCKKLIIFRRAVLLFRREVVLASAAEFAGEVIGEVFPLHAGFLFVIDPAAEIAYIFHLEILLSSVSLLHFDNYLK